MRHASLFSGIGGFDLAAEWIGWENVFQVEKDKFCQKVLAKNFPNVTRYGDIKEFDGTKYRGTIDIITGGFPCQPFSVAGKRKGKEDDRYLWPEMLRVIDEIKPMYIVGENVSGAMSMVDEIWSSLECRGYTTQPLSIEAACIGANHKRERLWFVAYSNSIRSQRYEQRMQEDKRKRDLYASILSPLPFCRAQTNNIPEPYITGGDDGVSDRAHRIKALGNAIVPQIAYELFSAIQSYEELQRV